MEYLFVYASWLCNISVSMYCTTQGGAYKNGQVDMWVVDYCANENVTPVQVTLPPCHIRKPHTDRRKINVVF